MTPLQTAVATAYELTGQARDAADYHTTYVVVSEEYTKLVPGRETVLTHYRLPAGAPGYAVVTFEEAYRVGAPVIARSSDYHDLVTEHRTLKKEDFWSNPLIWVTGLAIGGAGFWWWLRQRRRR